MRTLNDITPPSRRKEVEPLSKSVIRDRSPKFPFATFLTVIIVITASVGGLFYFSSAKIEVTPSTVSAAVQSSFTANESLGNLPYEILTAQKIASQSVKASGTKTVNVAASGTITIYNTQSTAQKLITNTRFATPENLIFRIKAPVTVPAGSAAKPGSISVKVYADQTGSAYNVGPTSFTIPGFAGSPQFTAVYARSSSSMTGGASGNVPVIDTTVETEARNALMKALEPDLIASLEAQVPEGYLLLPGSTKTTYEDLEAMPSSTTGMVDMKEQGTITAVIFPNAALAKAIATSVTGLGYQGEPLTLASASTITLSADRLPEPQAASFTFTLSGTASLIYTVDSTRIAAAVSGKTRAAAEVALTNYPEVKRAIIILRPFWRQTFPQDPASITITVANP